MPFQQATAVAPSRRLMFTWLLGKDNYTCPGIVAIKRRPAVDHLQNTLSTH